MFGKSPKLLDSVAELVPPGERVLAAVAVQPKGSGNGMAIGGIAGSMIAGRGSKATREASANTGVDVSRFAALAITNQRVLVLKMNAMGNKASAITGELPVDAIAGIDVSKSMLRKQIVVRSTGGNFEFETHKATPAEDLQEALAAARASA
jgi:hypothetical protein